MLKRRKLFRPKKAARLYDNTRRRIARKVVKRRLVTTRLKQTSMRLAEVQSED